MPVPPLVNTLEGGTDTTTITTGNSGAVSGNAFNTVTIGASATLTFSATHAHNGVLSMALSEPATPAITYVAWTGLGTITTSVYQRFYLWLVALPSATAYFQTVRTTADTDCALLRINTSTGFIQAANAALGAIAASLGSVACATGQWIRVETRYLASTTVGEVEWRLFNTADSVVADDTKLATSQVLGADIDKTRLGQPASSLIASQTVYFDDWAVSTAGWLGPAGTGTPPPPPNLPFMR